MLACFKFFYKGVYKMTFKKIAYSSVATVQGLGLIFNGGSVVFADDSDDEDYAFLFNAEYNPELDEEPDSDFRFGDDRIEFCPDVLRKLADNEFYRAKSIYNLRLLIRDGGSSKDDLYKVRVHYLGSRGYCWAIADYLAKNIDTLLTLGNADEVFVNHVKLISSAFKNKIEIENKIDGFKQQIGTLGKQIDDFKQKGLLDSGNRLIELNEKKMGIERSYEQIKKEYNEKNAELYKMVKAFLSHIRKKLKEKRKERRKKMIQEMENFSPLFNQETGNFWCDQVKIEKLIDICKDSKESKCSYVSFGAVSRCLCHFINELEIYAKCITEDWVKYVRNVLTYEQLVAKSEKIRELLKKNVEQNKQPENDVKLQLEILDKIMEQSKEEGIRINKDIKSSLRYSFNQLKSEILSTAEYLAEVEKGWEKEFKEDATSGFVKYIAKCYRYLTKLKEEYVFATLNKAFYGYKEFLRLKIQKTEDSLFSLVPYFYALICSKDKGVEPLNMWNYIFGIKECSISKSYEFTDVE